MNHDVHVAVIHYRTPELLEQCLQALVAHAAGARVTVVDTAPDETVLARAKQIMPQLNVVTPANHSYAHAVNTGFTGTTERYYLQMNADVFITEHTVPALRNACELHADRVIAAPRLHTADGAVQNMGPLYALHYARLALSSEPFTRVPWVSGAMQFIPTALFQELGGYDEQFRFTNEDIEFSLRAKQRGVPSVLVDTAVTHVGGASTPSAPAFFVEGRRGTYLLTERFHGEFIARLHRWYLHLEARVGPALFSRDANLVRAFALQQERLAAGTFSETPFGATLDDRLN